MGSMIDRFNKEAEKEKAKRAASGKATNTGIFAPPSTGTKISTKKITPSTLVQSTGKNAGALSKSSLQRITQDVKEEKVRRIEEKLAKATDRRSRAAYRQELMDAKYPLYGRDAKLSTVDKQEIQRAKENWSKADELEKKYGKKAEIDAFKRQANNAAERVRLRNGYSLRDDGKTEYVPELSDSDKKLSEVGQKNLRLAKLYYEYGKKTGNKELMEWAKEEAQKIRTPRSYAEVESSWSDKIPQDRNYLEAEVEKAKAEVKKAQNSLRAYTATIRGTTTFTQGNNPTLARLQAALKEKQDALKEAERRVERVDYVEKYQDKTYAETGNKWSDFWSQAKANFDLGRINQDASKAYNEYLKNPTPANKAYAEAMAELERDFQTRNEGVLDEEGQVLPWLSDSLAGYLPQRADQIIAGLKGAAVGAATGAGVGFTAGGIGTVPGAVWGGRAGAMAGVGKYSYDTMRGAAFRSLVESGVDEETAREAAKDEAVISSLIEMADTGVDIFTLGIGSALKAAGKTAAKTATKSAGKKLASALGKYGLNVASEMAQEGTQEAVSIANAQRLMTDDELSLWNLAKDAAGLTKQALSGHNEPAMDQMWEAAKEGGKIAAIMGGAGTVTREAATRGINKAFSAAGDTASDKTLGKRIKEQGDGMVQAIIDEGLSREDTAYLADPLVAKRREGKSLSDKEVGRLARAVMGEVALRTREETAQDTVLEDTAPAPQAENYTQAREFAAEEAKSAPAQARATTDDGNAILEQMAREMTANKTQEAKKAAKGLGYGQRGTQTFESILESGNMTVDEAKARFQSAYEAGLSNVPRNRVSLLGSIQEQAYNAGRQDYILSTSREASVATIYNKESGVVRNDQSAQVAPGVVDALDTVSKALGLKTVFREQIYGGMANGSYVDGILEVALDAEDPYMVVAKHEITHRIQDLAPTEYTAYRNYAVQMMASDLGSTGTTLVEQYQERAANTGMSLTTEGAMDEIAADFTENILTDEDALRKFVGSAAESKEQRTVVQKFFDAVRDFIQKVKGVFKGDKAKMDEAAQEQFGATIEQLEKAEKLWKEAYKAAEANVKAAGQQRGDAVIGGAASIKDQALEFSDKLTKFSLRKKEPPKKVGVAYKVFLAKDGELYPPMVANPGGAGTPVGMWLDADVGKPAPPSKTGRPQVQGGGKGTNSGKISLAFRPGWHLGDVPHATQFARKNPETGKKELFPANFVWAECEYAMDVDYQEEAMSYGYTEKGKFRHSYAGLPRLPEDGYYRYRTNPKPDTVPWVITGAMKVKRILTDAETDAICRENGVEPMAREGGPIDLAKFGLEAGETGAESGKVAASVKATKNATKEGGEMQTAGSLKYSLKMSFEEQVDATLNRELKRNTAVYVMETPEVLQKLGLKEYPMLMTQRHIRDVNHEKSPKNIHWHGIPVETIKKLPELIENPAMILKSASTPGDLVIVTTEVDPDGLPVIVAIKPDGSGRYNHVVVPSNFIKSVYGRKGFENFVLSAIRSDGVLYNDKKRTQSLYSRVRLQLPESLIRDGFFKGTVTQNGVNVKKPTDAPDIRFSLKANKDLMKENAKLREVNQGLKDQLKTTEFAKVDKKAMDQFTKKLLKDYFSGADINEVREMLDDLYTYLANGENGEVSWDEAQRRAYEAAVAVLESASVLDDEMWQSYKGLRDHLRTTPIRIDKQDSSSLMGYENLEDFRKRNFGRLKITNDGTPVDVVYQDLAVRYPEFFDEGRDMNPTDQLLTIVEVLDSLQPVEVNPYSYNMRESATWLANDILERFFELPQAKPTFADKADRKLTRQVIKDAKKLEKVREQKNQRIAQIIEENREKVKQVQAKERTKREEAVQQIKDHYKTKEAQASESRKARELRAKIMRHTKDLSDKLLKPTDKQHIPEALRGPVAAMLDAINQESQYTIDEATGKRQKGGEGLPTKRTEAFEALRKQYQSILDETAPAGDMVIDPAITAILEQVTPLRDVPLHAMNAAQLENLWQAIRAVEHSVSTAGKVLSQAKFGRTVEWAKAIADETATRRKMKGKRGEKFRVDMETPYTFFSHYGEAGKAIFRMLRDAQDKQQIMVEEVAAKVGEIVDRKQVKAWEKETHTFTTERGDELTLTTAQCMEIHELMKREQARNHLMRGGIVQPEVESKKIKRGTDAILLTERDLAAIVGSLTDEQVQVADRLQEITTTLLADYGNEASMQAYGYKKFTGKDYWPIKSAREGVQSNIEKGGNNSRSIKNIGMAKNTIPHASNPLDIGGVFKTFADHAGDMTDYAAWLCPMEDTQRLYNFQFRDELGQQTGKTMKGLLDRVGGKGAQQYWHNLMEDIQNGLSARSDSAFLEPINKVIGNVKGAAVGANLRVIIQQPTAILRAAAILNPADMATGLAVGGGWKKALEHSAIAKRKDMGGFDISSPMQMQEILFDKKKGLQRFNDAMMLGAGKADAITWGRIWNACEAATRRKHKDLTKGSQEFYEETARLFSEVIDQSQVVDGVLQRSQVMRSNNAILKQATSFMGEPTMALNMLLRAYDGLVNEKDAKKRGAAIKTFGRTAMVLLVTNVVNAMAQSLVDSARDDDGDKKYWERFWAAFTGITGEEESKWEKATAAVLSGNLSNNINPIGYIPVVKDVLSILQGYNVTRMDADVMGDIIAATKSFIDSLGEDGKKTVPYATMNMAKQIGKAFGVSAPNILRDVWGIMRSVAVETGNVAVQYEMEKAIYNLGGSSNKSRFLDILYRAYKTDQTAYKKIYADMVDGGISADDIAKGMEKRMKDDQGVEKTEDLENRYIPPSKQSEYNELMNGLESSGVWSDATQEQRDKAKNKVYELTMGKADETMTEKISAGAEYGIDEADYILYQLALVVADQPSEQGKLGSYTNAEKAQAVMSTGLSDSEKAYLWYMDMQHKSDEPFDALDAGIDIDTYIRFKEFDSTVEADKDENGKSINGSKKEKLRNWLNENNVGQDAYNFFMYEVKGYKS